MRTHRCAPTLFVFLFFCLIAFCRRDRPVCLPGISLLPVCFWAHTSVRPYKSLYHMASPVGADRCVCPKKSPRNGCAHTPVRPYISLFCVLLPCLRGRPVCLPGISLLPVCFWAHTSVRQGGSFLSCHETSFQCICGKII